MAGIAKLSPRGGPTSTTGAVHTISDTERKAYVDFFNAQLYNEPSLQGVLPLPGPAEFIENVKVGIICGKLINKFFPKAIDESKVYLKPKNTFERSINHEGTLAAAKELGCSIVNIGPNDLMAGTEHLVYGLTWQVIKACLLSKIKSMDLSKLQGQDENLPPEQILLRWFNWHLKNAGHHRTVANFSSDIMDSENYVVLLGQLVPEKISAAEVAAVRSETDLKVRAEKMLSLADRIGCRKFVTPVDVVEGNPRLNLAFVATLFAAYPALGATNTEKRLRELELRLEEVLRELAEVKAQKAALEEELSNSRSRYDQLANQLRETGLQLSQNIGDKDALLKQKADIERQMAELQAHTKGLNDQLNRLNRDKATLETNVSSQGQEKDQLIKLISDQQEQLRENKEQLKQTKSELDQLREQLEKERKARADAEQRFRDAEAEWQRRMREWQDDREKLLKRIRELEEENAMLKARLQEEMTHKFNYAQQLREKEEHLEKTVSTTDEERTSMQKRIRDLENELAQLRGDMRSELDRATREKEDALNRAQSQKESELAEQEAKRNRDLDKVRLLLTGNTKQGWLHKQAKGMITTWKKKYFVLKAHNLYWYKDEKDVTSTRPKGVVACDSVRLYELDPKESDGRQFAFQLLVEGTNKKINLCAPRMDDMKDWMTEIRLAKKKKLGVEAATHDLDATNRRSMAPGALASSGSFGPSPVSPRTSMQPMGGSVSPRTSMQPMGGSISPRTSMQPMGGPVSPRTSMQPMAQLNTSSGAPAPQQTSPRSLASSAGVPSGSAVAPRTMSPMRQQPGSAVTPAPSVSVTAPPSGSRVGAVSPQRAAPSGSPSTLSAPPTQFRPASPRALQNPSNHPPYQP